MSVTGVQGGQPASEAYRLEVESPSRVAKFFRQMGLLVWGLMNMDDAVTSLPGGRRANLIDRRWGTTVGTFREIVGDLYSEVDAVLADFESLTKAEFDSKWIPKRNQD